MDNLSWLEHPALKSMHPAKKEILIDIVKESNGKPLNQSIPVLIKAQNRLKAEGQSFTSEESALMMSIITKDLSPSDMAKVEAMKKMMNR